MRTTVLTVPIADVELAADRLWAAGARGVEERVASPSHTSVHAVLGADDSTARARLGPVPPAWTVSFVDVDDEPASTWREHVVPIRVGGGLVIRPAWLDPVGEVHEIAIEPGGSFGLGDHPTTILSAAATWDAVRPGDRVLDVGCGSGVLSVVAARRGARSVVAIDVAEAAVAATLDNARRNGVADRITASSTPAAEITARFDVVVANILAPTLVALADELRRVTARTLVVSGVLADNHHHVVAALDPMQVRRTTVRDAWAAIALVHPDT